MTLTYAIRHSAYIIRSSIGILHRNPVQMHRYNGSWFIAVEEHGWRKVTLHHG